MICVICRQAEIMDGITSVSFARDEFWLSVNNVPARVCPGCDEAYVAEEVAAQLLLAVEEIYQVGMLEEIIDYERLHLK